ncbi:hypothetical protein B0T09DRAFT_348845 [Sordaria sp. MPI-SDFR-AT-0083]|nr:hypothetical protein B0T09DRAFT_348845 [Sordaria sp. MPI-SDFR-AT-0083]
MLPFFFFVGWILLWLSPWRLRWIRVIQVHCGELEVVIESATGDGASDSRPRSGPRSGLFFVLEDGVTCLIHTLHLFRTAYSPKCWTPAWWLLTAMSMFSDWQSHAVMARSTPRYLKEAGNRRRDWCSEYGSMPNMGMEQ